MSRFCSWSKTAVRFPLSPDESWWSGKGLPGGRFVEFLPHIRKDYCNQNCWSDLGNLILQ